MITLKQWAVQNGLNPNTARKWANRGKIEAVKMGRDWFVEEDTKKPVDRRFVENPIRNRRKNEQD